MKKAKKAKKAKLFSIKCFLYDFVRVTGMPLLLWFRPKKIYVSKAAKKKIWGGALIVSNHIGFFDAMYLLLGIWYRRHHFVATKELFKGKFNNWLFKKVFKCIEIDRENFTVASFKTIVEHLKMDELVTMFPEGRINQNKEGVQAFKSGVTFMAIKSGAPIVPVYIKRRKHFWSRLVIGVGEPLKIEPHEDGTPITIDEINRITEELHEQELRLETLCTAKKK